MRKWEELSDLEQAATIYSDFYKDANGIRPGGYYGHPKTVEEYDKEIDRLGKVIKEQTKEEAKREKEAYKEWKEFLNSYMLKHDVSQSTAIKWDMEAQEVLDDVEHYCYLSQLSFDRESEIKALL